MSARGICMPATGDCRLPTTTTGDDDDGLLEWLHFFSFYHDSPYHACWYNYPNYRKDYLFSSILSTTHSLHVPAPTLHPFWLSFVPTLLLLIVYMIVRATLPKVDISALQTSLLL